MVLHVLECVRPLCHCMRVPHPHRPAGFPLCEKNPDSDVLKAQLEGATREEVEELIAELAFSRPGRKAVECPF